MTTTATGGKITGLLALTMATDVALNEGDFVQIVGDYKVGLSDGTKRSIGQVSVRSVVRVVTATSSTFPVATTTGGQVTVEARAYYVSVCQSGGAIAAGDDVIINNSGALVSGVGNTGDKATLKTGVIANNNAITWTAQDGGAAGNGISITLHDPGAASQALGVVVSGNDIVVNLATSAGSAITSTPTTIIAAIAASAAANSLVVATNTGASTGAAAVVAAATANLAGGAAGDSAGRVGVALTSTTGSAQSFDLLVD